MVKKRKLRKRRPKVQVPHEASYLAEYPIIAESWRFLTGRRFSLLAFSATLQSALIAGYQFVLINHEKLGKVGLAAFWAIPVFGIISSFSVILIEARTRSLYGACLIRGRHIEEALFGMSSGHFHALWNAPLPHRVATHTRVLGIMYLSNLIVWCYLTYYGFSVAQ